MDDVPAPESKGEIIIYRTDDGRAEINLRAQGDTVWLTQNEIAELFDTSKQSISRHAANIYSEGELSQRTTVNNSLTLLPDGRRYRTKVYNLPMILAIGYRVRSPRGMQFRQWATRHLAEYLVKGFVMDDARLKDLKGRGRDHFDELLARIREIRASEKRFYQKVRDLFKLSDDYADDETAARLFFAETQNKLLYAITGKTAAEIIVDRADAGAVNMGLTAWEGGRVRKGDVSTAKNYLTEDEIDLLNRLAVIFLDQAELRTRERKRLTLAYWRENVDRLLRFNDRPVLQGPGRVSHDEAVRIAHERYEVFDDDRRTAEAKEADAEDLRELEEAERLLEGKGGGQGTPGGAPPAAPDKPGRQRG